MRIVAALMLSCITIAVQCQDSVFLKVHFLYGSKPAKQFKATEPKWFGGMPGGHVGIEADSGKIINFVPHGKFHWFARKHDKHGKYVIHSENDFYAILGGDANGVKKTIVYIPISLQQKKSFDSLTNAYLQETPYDYALFGMRCGAAAHDILGKIGLMPDHRYRRTWKKIFYPKKLRKRLLKKAASYQWNVVRIEGSATRKWESD